jgi:hypothetical protein
MRLLPLFDDGALFRAEYGFRVMRRVHAGELDVVEGVVIADPWDLDEAKAIAAPDGRHAVDLAVACWDVVAEAVALRVSFRDAKPVRWRRADPASATTDSATLALTDAGTSARLAVALREFTKREAFVEGLIAAMEDAPAGRADVEGGTVFAAPTGSDGGFATWIGLDEAGAPICLAVDFAKLDPSALKRLKPKHGEVPRTFGPELLDWLTALGARTGEPLIEGPGLEEAIVAELARLAGAPAPVELAEYYARATPLRDGTTLSTWLALRSALPARARGAWWPIALRDERAGIVARAHEGAIVEVIDFDGGGAYLAGPDLRTFFVNQALTLFPEQI